MKRILYTLVALAAVVGFTSCETKNNKGQLDPNAMISLRPAEGVPSGKAETVNPKHLTAAEIVRQVDWMTFWNVNLAPVNAMDRGFADTQRDFVHNRLLMWGTDVITTTGKLNTDIIECTDWLFLIVDEDNRYAKDTVAYIPNSVIRKAEKEIKAAFANGDYTTCYKILDTEFVFTPITGAEWREKRAAGLI